jgi:hypothetical protein
VPLQSIESIIGFRTLLPGFEAALMTLARFPELSNWKIVLYWLSTPSSVLHNRLKPVLRSMRFSLSVLCPPKWTFSHDLSLVLRALPFLPQPQKAVDSPEVWFPNSAKQFEFTNLGLPLPVRSAYRLSQPYSGLLLDLPCGFISCYWHLRDSPSEFSPWKQHRTFVRFDFPI